MLDVGQRRSDISTPKSSRSVSIPSPCLQVCALNRVIDGGVSKKLMIWYHYSRIRVDRERYDDIGSTDQKKPNLQDLYIVYIQHLRYDSSRMRRGSNGSRYDIVPTLADIGREQRGFIECWRRRKQSFRFCFCFWITLFRQTWRTDKSGRCDEVIK